LDDLPPAVRRDRISFFLGSSHLADGSLPSFLTPGATNLSVPSRSGLCASGFRRMTPSSKSPTRRRCQNHRHCPRMDSANFRVRLRREEREEVVGGLAFLHLPYRRPVGPDAGNAGEGRLSSIANQISPPSALLNSLNEVNVITQQLPTPSGGGTRCGRSANEMASRSKLGTTTSGRRAKRTYPHSTRSEKCLQVATRFRKRHSRAGNRAISRAGLQIASWREVQ
jgi:hypothetical protein